MGQHKGTDIMSDYSTDWKGELVMCAQKSQKMAHYLDESI